MTCTFEGCTNNKFAPHKECALHCVKSNYQDDSLKGILSEFYKLLSIYIADLIDSTATPMFRTRSGHTLPLPKPDPNSNYKIGISQRIRNENLNGEEIRKLISTRNVNELIILQEIHFPDRKSRDSFDYFQLLELFSDIHLLDCHFYIGDWQLGDVSFFFQGCMFYNQFDITPVRMLSNDTNCLFSECDFKNKVRVSPTEINSIFEDSLFSGCSFENDLVIERLIFRKEVISYTDNTQSKLFAIEISKCIFEDKIKINNMKLACLNIEDTEFQSKLEVKETTAQLFIFKNSNVSKVFDLFGSNFIKAKFSKSIFNDFAGFEDVQFGSEQEKGNKDFLTIFKYVTFMDFSSFRGAKFSSGLDFSKTNLKDTPNFLDVHISPENTDRETFRIVKNSFDDTGNKIEANRFFVKEMNAYQRELIKTKDKEVRHIKNLKNSGKKDEVKLYKNSKSYKSSKRARWVFNINSFISEFGSNYMRPISILFFLAIIYTSITLWHEWYFKSHEYFMSWKWFDFISKPLNEFAINILPFRIFIKDRSGIEFISLIFYVLFAILIWQIVVAVKRHTQR